MLFLLACALNGHLFLSKVDIFQQGVIEAFCRKSPLQLSYLHPIPIFEGA